MITIPKLNQLYEGILTDLETAMGTTIPRFGKNFLRVLAGVQAAKIWLIYKGLGFVQKNIFVDTADPESSGGTLERFGRVKLGRNPFPARAGQYVVVVNGSPGAVIPASTTFKSNDDSLNPGKLFVLDIPFTFIGSSGNVVLRALEPGLGSKLIAEDLLTVTGPIANVDSLVGVITESISPLVAETVEAYRGKAIEAYQLEPHGGAPSDFRLWAYDAQGVARAYPYAKTGSPGEINLYIEATVADSTDGKGTPGAGILAEVEDVVNMDPDTTKPLNERGRRPIGAVVHYLPVEILEVDITIDGFQGITTAIRTAITNALKTELDNVRPFIGGADVLENKNDIFDKNKIISTILTVRPGSTFGTVTLEVGGVDVNTKTFISGEIPHLNSVTIP